MGKDGYDTDNIVIVHGTCVLYPILSLGFALVFQVFQTWGYLRTLWTRIDKPRQKTPNKNYEI